MFRGTGALILTPITPLSPTPAPTSLSLTAPLAVREHLSLSRARALPDPLAFSGRLFNGALSNTFRGTGAAMVLVLYDWMSKFI
jgi:hypothetical protein